jgi:sortase (surface protein transpeptidase)
MRARLETLWRACWDPESEVLVLTLASAILAGVGIALIMMGAMPATGAAQNNAVLAGAPASVRESVAVPDPSRTRKPARPDKKPGAHQKSKAPRQLKPSIPLALNIPAIGVHTRLMSLGLQKDGTVEVPPLEPNAPAGWYRNLSTPGEPGPAVILGHVDSARDGPAVFYRLRELRRGDRVSVDRADGSRVNFTVRSVARYPKKDFPTAAVYGPRPGAELRLVTCGGSFDALRRHYRDNIVVFAALS